MILGRLSFGSIKSQNSADCLINIEENDKKSCSSGKLLSAFFDQFSSVDKPEFALAAIVIAIVGFLVCTTELAYNGKKGKIKIEMA
ncbi:hypothetical protein V6N13_013978 [Hibiscus sabdariffa]